MPRAALLLLGSVLVSAPVAAKTGLSAVAEEAAKPPAEQKIVGEKELSEVKHKEPAPAAEAPAQRSAPLSHHGSGAVPVHVGGGYHPPSGVGSVAIIDPETAPSPPRVRFRFGAVAAGAGLAADSFGGFGSGGVLVGCGSGRVSLDVRGQYSVGRFSKGLSPSFENPQGISGDAVGRVRVSEPYARVDVNLMLMARLGRYGWNFRNPVQVAEPDGIHTYDHDAIRYRAFMVGLGVVPLHGWEWSLQITAAGGHQRFEGETEAGFVNDLFSNGAVGEVLVEVLYSPF